MNWSEKQDEQITQALTAVAEAYNHASPARRLWAQSEELLYEKHFLNVVSRRKRDEHFRVLDVGCGRAELLNRIARHFPNSECLGLEPNGPSLATARGHGLANMTVFEGGFERARELGSFDVVICSEVFEHVLDKDGLLDTVASAVGPGGMLSISTPSGWMYRLPGPYNLYKLLQSPSRFCRLYLQPEQNWEEALTVHPAILPGKLRRMLERRGLVTRRRQSSLWWLLEPGALYCTFAFLERRGWSNAGIYFYHVVCVLEALMNLVPPLRIFESRFVLMCEKR
jgi:2-polyprenyl-3-methyl-5-hydroxy-6-metoxy-1,4-benzoquinol methylase